MSNKKEETLTTNQFDPNVPERIKQMWINKTQKDFQKEVAAKAKKKAVTSEMRMPDVRIPYEIVEVDGEKQRRYLKPGETPKATGTPEEKDKK